MSLELVFEIELHSDYHVSAGHGLGPLVDSALQRDMDGIPVLRGTTVTGLLRDGLYELLQLEPFREKHRACQASGLPKQNDDGKETPRFCGQHDPGRGNCPVCHIFGSPRTPRRWRISSARPVDLSTPLKAGEGWRPGETGSQVAPHVRVSPRTRRAENGKLFFREEGDARLNFEFTATCEAEDGEILAEAAWLLAAARCVRHLGASRRRGRGECSFGLKRVTGNGSVQDHPPEGQTWQDWLLDRFERWHLKNVEKPPAVSPPEYAPSTEAKKSQVHLLLVARLDEPLIVSERARAGNEYRTLEHVPGTALRGAFAGRAAAAYDLENDATAYSTFVRLFFRDGVRFSPLYPTHRDGDAVYPAVPAPRALLTCRLYPGFAISDISTAHGAESFAHRTAKEDAMPNCRQCEEGHSRVKGAMKPFEHFLGLRYPPDQVKVQTLTEMHVHIDPETRRAADSDLFSFHTLAPGQYLVGDVTCASAATRDDFGRLCSATGAFSHEGLVLHLGKANRRGYGRVTIWLLERQGEEHPWCQLPFSARVADPTAPLTMMLLTDTILLDPWGRSRTTLDRAWLESKLGVEVKVGRTFCANRVVDTYNAYLGLPRWRDVALCAGSTVGFQVEGEGLSDEEVKALLDRLQKIERQGVGLRRGEGFGQVVFNHPLYGKCKALGDSARIGLAGDGRRMGLATGGGDRALAVEDTFRQEWEARLLDDQAKYQDDEKSDPFAHQAFAALARLLRSESPSSQEDVEALKERLGQPAELLPAAIREELSVRETERAGLNFFRTDAKPGLDALVALVTAMGQMVEGATRRLTGPVQAETQRRCWCIGLELLADRIAAAAGKEER